MSENQEDGVTVKEESEKMQQEGVGDWKCKTLQGPESRVNVCHSSHPD